MDKLEKALKKLSVPERRQVESILQQLVSGEMQGLDIKKLKGQHNIFRVRKGMLRILYRVDKQGTVFPISLGKRSDKTYHF